MKEKINNNWRDNIDYIIQEYNKGKSMATIAKEFDKTSSTTIHRVLKRNSVKTRNYSECQKPQVTKNPFCGESEESQYWTGFFIGDGNITKSHIRISLSSKDKGHLDTYSEYVGVKVKPLPGVDAFYVGFSNKEIANELVTFGIHRNKSFTVNPTMPLSNHILRGIFDADGCVSFSEKSETRKSFSGRIQIVTGSKALADKMLGTFKSNGINFLLRTYKNNNLYYLNLHKIIEIQKFYDFIYKDASVFLERKYTKCGLLLQKYKRQYAAKTGN
jgi:hypothetical protein